MGKFETLCGMLPADVNWGDPITPEIIEEIVLAERETCAEICDKHAENMARHGDAELAEQSRQDAVAIRARSNAEFRPTHAASSREVVPATQGYACNDKGEKK